MRARSKEESVIGIARLATTNATQDAETESERSVAAANVKPAGTKSAGETISK